MEAAAAVVVEVEAAAVAPAADRLAVVVAVREEADSPVAAAACAAAGSPAEGGHPAAGSPAAVGRPAERSPAAVGQVEAADAFLAEADSLVVAAAARCAGTARADDPPPFRRAAVRAPVDCLLREAPVVRVWVRRRSPAVRPGVLRDHSDRGLWTVAARTGRRSRWEIRPVAAIDRGSRARVATVSPVQVVARDRKCLTLDPRAAGTPAA